MTTTTTTTYADLDHGVCYQVDGYRGVAFYIVGPVVLTDDDYDTYDSEDRVLVCMVGDDTIHDVGVDEVTPIADDAFCDGCGQIGCTADGRSE